MFTWHDYFDSVQDVWILFAVGCLTLVVLARMAFVRIRNWNPRAIAVEENGASYALSVVLVLPVFAFLVCVIVECTLMLVVKMGTLYAAYAAARSAIVWIPADAGADKPREAAVQAMAPFASGDKHHLAALGPMAWTGEARAAAYYAAYSHYTKGTAMREYVMSKYLFANRATSISIEPAGEEFNSDLAVSVHYEMPLHVPGVGRLFGQRASWPLASFFTRIISSRATLQKEAPRTRDQSLGIPYDSSI